MTACGREQGGRTLSITLETMMIDERRIAASLEASASCYCPSCLERISKGSFDGGRCLECGTTLSAVHLSECPSFIVSRKGEEITVRAENILVLEKAIRGFGQILYGAQVRPA